MGDILSQNEIDRLLQQLNTGELDVKEFSKDAAEKKVRNHDFRRPSKFARIISEPSISSTRTMPGC